MSYYVSQPVQKIRAEQAWESISKISNERLPTHVPSLRLGSEQVLLKNIRMQDAEEERHLKKAEALLCFCSLLHYWENFKRQSKKH